MSPRQRQEQCEAHKRKRKFKRRTQFKKFSQNRKPGQAHTRPSFCESNAISESKYFDLKRKGKGPREIELDGRIIITPEAEADWRRDREAETLAAQRDRIAETTAATNVHHNQNLGTRPCLVSQPSPRNETTTLLRQSPRRRS
jgi:hypothetical protein